MKPADEMVDVIDDAGRTTAVVPRAQMRALRLPHRCVYVLVFNKKGELFIHLRTLTKDVYPGHWDACIGGVLAAGESFDEGAAREVQEELGIVAAPQALFPIRYEDSQTRVLGRVYRMEHEGPFRLQAEEIVRGEFVTVEELFHRADKETFCPDGMAVVHEYLHSKENRHC